MSKECENCIKRKTMWCPPSCECMALDEFPYYLDKILALEKIDKLEQENKQLKENLKIIRNSWNDKTKDEVYLKMSKETLVKIINLKRDTASYLNRNNNNLKSILTELEEYIGQEWYCFDNESIEFEVAKDILDKIQELKEKYK